jgi:hypothetical protein
MPTPAQKNRMKMRLTEAVQHSVGPAAPAVNAVIFAENTNKNAGESFNLNTKQFSSEQTGGRYIVGGESDASGKRIKTKYEGRGRKAPKLTAAAAAKHLERASLATKNAKNANLGSWVDPENIKKGVQMDVSSKFSDRAEATKVMEDRNEDAMWDLKANKGKGGNIYNLKKKKK